MIKKIIGTIFIVSGICIIVYALYNRFYFDNINKRLVAFYENEYSEKSTEAVLGDFSGSTQAESVYEENTVKNLTENLPVDVIGVITIDKIGLNAAIAEGSDYYTIRYSVGHFENTPLPADGGNFCILGHRSYTYGQFFNRVDELDIGDLIDINIGGMSYTYRIYDIYETVPNDVAVLDNSDKNEITIVTCTMDGKNRVIVKGTMLEYKDDFNR